MTKNIYRCATVPFSCGLWIVTSRFSVNMEVFSQGNPPRRSLQGPRSATSAGLLTEHIVLVYLFIYLCSSLSDYTLISHTIRCTAL